MATYVLIHGAGDVAFYWHLVGAELRARGHDVVAMGLPAAVAPDSNGWPTLVTKVIDQALDFNGWQREDLRAIGSPARVIAGDADIIRPEHAVETYRLIPDSRLAILPGSDHVQVITRADWLLAMIAEFLDAPDPATSATMP